MHAKSASARPTPQTGGGANGGYPEVADLRGWKFTDPLKPLITTALSSGCRRGELRQLRTRRCGPRARRAGDPGSWAKSGQTRGIPLSWTLDAALQAGRDKDTDVVV